MDVGQAMTRFGRRHLRCHRAQHRRLLRQGWKFEQVNDVNLDTKGFEYPYLELEK
jgi:hypothetical protein